MKPLGRLRVVMCLPAFVPAIDYGGPVGVVKLLASGLGDLGHHVEVWCANYGYGRSWVEPGTQTVDGAQVRYFRRIAQYRWAPVVPQAYVASRGAVVDVLHLFGVRDGFGLFAAAAMWRRKIPYIVEPLGMLKRQVRNSALKAAVDGLVTNRLVSHSAGLVVTSQLEHAEAKVRSQDVRTWVRPNPICVTPQERDDCRGSLRRRLGVSPDQFLVGYIGRISTKKGLDILVDACSRVPNVRLVISGPDTGDGGLRQLRDTLKSVASEDVVHVLPPLWEVDRDAFLSGLDVFVLPSLTENFGNAAAEAAALGTPVVVTPTCGVAEIIDGLGCGRVVDLGVSSLSECLADLSMAREESARMGERGREAGTLLCPSKIAKMQEAIYKELLITP